MPRLPRQLYPHYCYHVTIRCNNREFRLTRFACREWLLYSIHKCKEKYGFKLYGLCIMSNHVHYLLEPQEPNDLPKIMHWLNWYTAMGLEICAAAYRKFCKRYQPSPKTERKNHWGSKLLTGLTLRSKPATKKKRPSPGQMSLWKDWQPYMDEVHKVAKQFVLANSLNPDIAAAKFTDTT